MDAGVKRVRNYDSTRRRNDAQRRRDTVVAVAGRLFLANGYGATTLPSIAREGGVSVEFIYKQFGSKAALLRAVHDKALEGNTPVPPYQRADAAGVAELDPYRLITLWATLVAEVTPRVAPVLLLVRSAAATAPEAAALWDELEQRRLHRMAENAQHLASRGQLRPGCTPEHARDVLWAYTSPELYERLVLRQGWSTTDFGRFVRAGMTAALLP